MNKPGNSLVFGFHERFRVSRNLFRDENLDRSHLAYERAGQKVSHHEINCVTYVAQVSFPARDVAVTVVHAFLDSLHVFSILKKIP